MANHKKPQGALVSYVGRVRLNRLQTGRPLQRRRFNICYTLRGVSREAFALLLP